MMKKGTRLTLFLAGVLALLSIGVGHAAFQTGENGATDSFDGTVTLRKPVCYISGTKNVYYASIESALSVAEKSTGSQTIYVIPGTNPTIRKDCTIASGDSLVLPYADDGTTHSVEKFEASDSDCQGTAFADSNPSAYRKSQVTLAEGVKLTNKGTLTIGGIQGWLEMRVTGMTVNQYAEITMGANSTIENDGAVLCYGYIKETSPYNGALISHSSSSNLKTPMVVYDYRGGSYSTYAASHDIMPFNVFDFPNIQVNSTFNAGCTWKVMVKLSLKGATTAAPAILASSSSSEPSLIRLDSGYINYRYDSPRGYSYSDYSASQAEADIAHSIFRVNGDISISSMTMNIGVPLNTADFFLPFSYKFRFYFESGNSAITNKVKFLAGCYAEVKQGASLSLSFSTIAYQNYIPAITTGHANTGYYPNYTTSATIVNNGSVTISSGFGGVIQTSSSHASLVTTGTFSSSVSTSDAIEGNKGGLSGSTTPHSETARFTLIDTKTYVSSSDTEFTYGNATGGLLADTVESGKSYSSHRITGTSDYGWFGGVGGTYGLRFYLDGNNTASNPNSVSSFSDTGGTITLTDLTTSNPTKWTFGGFYYDSNFSKPLKNNQLVPSEALRYLGEKNYVMIYPNWLDNDAGKYQVTIQEKMIQDHQNRVDASGTAQYSIYSSCVLPSDISQDYLYINVNSSAGTGSIQVYRSAGYQISISNGTTTILSFAVDSSGNSSNGVVNDWVFRYSGIGDGYLVTATRQYDLLSETPYDFNMNPGSITVDYSGSTFASISNEKSPNAFETNCSIPLEYLWTSRDSDLLTVATPTSSSTNLNNAHSSFFGISKKVKIDYQVSDSQCGLVLFTGSQQYKLLGK